MGDAGLEPATPSVSKKSVIDDASTGTQVKKVVYGIGLRLSILLKPPEIGSLNPK